MVRRVVIRGEEAEVTVELDGGELADELWGRLPLESRARLKGGEVHFPVLIPPGIEAPERNEIETGDVAYWPPENALCLFFGETPARTDKEGPVSPVGRIVAGLEDCGLVGANETLKIEAAG